MLLIHPLNAPHGWESQPKSFQLHGNSGNNNSGLDVLVVGVGGCTGSDLVQFALCSIICPTSVAGDIISIFFLGT